MRHLPKFLFVAVASLSIGMMTPSVRANEMLAGTFTLEHPTQWKSTMLPAGNYRFKLAHTQTDSNLLVIRGQKQALDILVFPQSECKACKSGALTVDLRNDHRIVTSLELPGYRLEFNGNRPMAENREQSAKAPAPAEQVAVHVNPN